jgi:hypothetical protein
VIKASEAVTLGLIDGQAIRTDVGAQGMRPCGGASKRDGETPASRLQKVRSRCAADGRLARRRLWGGGSAGRSQHVVCGALRGSRLNGTEPVTSGAS